MREHPQHHTTAQTIQHILAKEISVTRENTFWNHLITSITWDIQLKGHTSPNGFAVWRYSFWSGLLYPVIHGTFETNEGRLKVHIRSKMNPVGRLVLAVAFGLLAYGVVTGIMLRPDNTWAPWNILLLGLLMLGIPALAVSWVIRFEHRKAREKIIELFKQG